MTDTPAAFQATFSDWRLVKGRKVVQCVFEVPIEGAGLAYDVLGGMPDPSKSVWCAIARLNLGGADDVERETAPRPVPDKPPAGARKSPAQMAGILCGERLFRTFLTDIGLPAFETEAAAAVVREYCDVESRSEILPGTPAGDKWEQLLAKFEMWKRT